MRTTGVFQQSEGVQCLIAALRDAGIAAEEMSVVVRDPEAPGIVRPETEVHSVAAENAKRGGMVGALAGAVLGLSLVVLPGVGPLLAAGPAAQLLAGAAAAATGAAAGGILGALTGLLLQWGIPEAQARAYSEAIERGEAVVSLPHDETHDIAEMFRRCGAHDIFTNGPSGPPEGVPSNAVRGRGARRPRS